MVALVTRTRAELVREQAVRPPFGGRDFAEGEGPVRVGITGSGPTLLLLSWTEADLARERAAGARVFGRLGIRPGMRVANALPGALATPGALVVGDVDEEIGALDVPLGEIDTPAAAASAWELLDRVEVHVLILDPARAAMLLAAVPARARPWWQGIVWLARPRVAPSPPAVAGFDGWQRRWLAVPEVSSFVAGECAERRLHVDAAFAPAVEGGELVLGPLHPGVAWRYRTGHAARALGRCGCGADDLAFES
jgi:hypothetical protein